jgi:hypothetical protein
MTAAAAQLVISTETLHVMAELYKPCVSHLLCSAAYALLQKGHGTKSKVISCRQQQSQLQQQVAEGTDLITPGPAKDLKHSNSSCSIIHITGEGTCRFSC